MTSRGRSPTGDVGETRAQELRHSEAVHVNKGLHPPLLRTFHMCAMQLTLNVKRDFALENNFCFFLYY